MQPHVPDWRIVPAAAAGSAIFLPRKALGKELARKALQIDSGLGEAHASLAWALTHYDYDFVRAEQEYERSIELNPRYATAQQWSAMLLLPLGRFDESATEFKRAIRLDPLSPIINLSFAWNHFYAGRLDQSLETCNKTLD